MPGGLDNPLGARARDLQNGSRNTMHRINGTNEPWSIGQNVSNDPIRLINHNIIDLDARVPEGTPAVVRDRWRRQDCASPGIAEACGNAVDRRKDATAGLLVHFARTPASPQLHLQVVERDDVEKAVSDGARKRGVVGDHRHLQHGGHPCTMTAQSDAAFSVSCQCERALCSAASGEEPGLHHQKP
jgi:hypothetical protein